MNDFSNKFLSDLVSFRTYSKYLPHLYRRETLEETINRNMQMHLDKFGGLSKSLSKDIIKTYSYVHDLKAMPSMRSMQFAGKAIEKNNLRMYNCSFTNVDDVRVFGEIFFLLLCGCGVGFSVQEHHINKIPRVVLPKEEGVFFIHDSITGWAQSIDMLFDAYLFGKMKPVFNYSQIRPKNSYMHTTGAKAPGPEPLKYMLDLVEEKLKNNIGKKLSSIEIYDIICIISDAVLAGGIRRSSLICLFDRNDSKMLNSKTGNWWEKHPYRARSNNSAVLPRDEVTEEEFFEIFNTTKLSNSGEPGFSWTNDKYNQGFNPCHEIALNSNQLCNLTTINLTGLKGKEDYLKRVHAATLLGTLQAAYTDFPYLRPIWKETTEKEALLGVSKTGIADCPNIPNEWLIDGARLCLELNEKYSRILGINIAARTTTIKPEGSSSCVFSSSSGVHDRYSDFYIRRVRHNKDESLSLYLKNKIPDLIEEDLTSPNTIVISIPQKSPNGALLRSNSSAIELLDRAMKYNRNWVKPGHRYGPNNNNVSLTVYVKENEWAIVRDYMWKNRLDYSGISLFPYDGGSYKQAPFEECSKEKYEELSRLLKNVDFREVKEMEDSTSKIEIVACSGNSCEIV